MINITHNITHNFQDKEAKTKKDPDQLRFVLRKWDNYMCNNEVRIFGGKGPTGAIYMPREIPIEFMLKSKCKKWGQIKGELSEFEISLRVSY